MNNDLRTAGQVSGHPVRGRLAHRLTLRNRSTMWRISAERPPVREAAVWLSSAHDGQHFLQPSSLRLVLSATSYHHVQPLTFGRR